jgi:glycosyltransferase involved in cell wall biosynthesis
MKRSRAAIQSAEKLPRLMLFDLALGGHHGNYIQHLIEYSSQTSFRAIDIVVLPQFLDIHHDTVHAISKCDSLTINLVCISPEEVAALGSRHSGISRALRNFREWQIFCRYAAALQPTQALVMYLDTCELPLALGLPSPCPFSGIYFRPTFHYNTFSSYCPSRKEKLQQWRETITLKRILQHPQLRTVFCLDPFAVEAIDADRHSAAIVHLADPVDPHPNIQFDLLTRRADLGIDPDRQVFLLFGALDGRKGIYQLLDAIRLLPPQLSVKLCLLLVGKTSAAEQTQIQHKVSALCQTHPIQLIECYDFVPESDVLSYFQLADVVLAPYQRHVGMSGILLLAAAAGKPVLSSDYGLMGELVRRYQLGLTVDSASPQAIADGLRRCLLEPKETLGDRSQMKIFAEQNSIANYASTIFQHLHSSFSNVALVEVEEA